MTLDQFLVALEGLAGIWRIDDSGRLRCEGGHCPLVAVASGAGYRHEGEWDRSAALLGLDGALAGLIVRAADYDTGPFRDRLLAATGVTRP